MSPLRASIAVLLALSLPAFAQKKKEEIAPRTEAEILKTVTLPEGYAATVFALPPMGGYPTSVSAAIDGTLFVAIDENGSLGRDRIARTPSATASSNGKEMLVPSTVADINPGTRCAKSPQPSTISDTPANPIPTEKTLCSSRVRRKSCSNFPPAIPRITQCPSPQAPPRIQLPINTNGSRCPTKRQPEDDAPGGETKQ